MKRATVELKGDWLWQVLACPRCNGRLKPAQNLVRCAACGPYPLLGGVPILVPDAAGWCASFYDSVLSALAEHGLATREAVHVVGAFARGRTGEAQRFGDDWTRYEAHGEDEPAPVRGPGRASLLTVRRAGLKGGPAAWLARQVGTATLALEVGCGVGVGSELLAAHTKRLVVGDYSLRAVLNARARAERGPGAVAGVVLDAAALPVARGALDLLVAENVVDLLDEPRAFFEGVRDALAKKGRALVTTPDPALGGTEDDAVQRLAVAARLKVSEVRDGLPWVRLNSARHVEVYLVQALALAHADSRR
jgi:SAM-dependent methyltransferase/uncharacterized protein YbaR (Trm112 family)